MAAATSTDTVGPPPGSERGNAALPVSDAAMSHRTFSAARLNPHVQARALN